MPEQAIWSGVHEFLTKLDERLEESAVRTDPASSHTDPSQFVTPLLLAAKSPGREQPSTHSQFERGVQSGRGFKSAIAREIRAATEKQFLYGLGEREREHHSAGAERRFCFARRGAALWRERAEDADL